MGRNQIVCISHDHQKINAGPKLTNKTNNNNNVAATFNYIYFGQSISGKQRSMHIHASVCPSVPLAYVLFPTCFFFPFFSTLFQKSEIPHFENPYQERNIITIELTSYHMYHSIKIRMNEEGNIFFQINHLFRQIFVV